MRGTGPDRGTRSWSADRLGVVLLCGCAALAALLELLLVPLRIGTTLVPVTVLFALAGNVAFPRLAHVLIASPAAALAPFLAWLAPMLILSMTPRPAGDVLVRGGGGEQWVFYGVLLGGAVAGTATVVLSAPSRRARLLAAQRALYEQHADEGATR
jgi:hypothetical protein